MALTDIAGAIASSGIADAIPGQLDVDAVLDLVVRDAERAAVRAAPVMLVSNSNPHRRDARSTRWNRPSFI